MGSGFRKRCKTIKEVNVVSHTETPGYGALMEEDSFLSQFEGISAPIYLTGKAPVAEAGDTGQEAVLMQQIVSRMEYTG